MGSYERIGIIGAMEEEVAILRARLKDLHNTGAYQSGRLGGKEIALLQCGIGKVNAAVGATLLIDGFNPNLVINTGVAGGVNHPGMAPLSFGDVVLSEQIVYHDVDVTGFGYKTGQIPGLDPFFSSPPDLLAAAESAIGALKTAGQLPSALNCVRGMIASGDVFMCEAGRIKMVSETFPGLRAVEMEGAAIAHVCTIFAVPFLIIRALSDIAGEESPVDYEAYLPVAAQHSSEIVLKLIETL